MKQFEKFLDLVDRYKKHNHNSEVLHDLRVGCRRLSSLIDRSTDLAYALKKLRKLSNEIRDIDVFKEEFYQNLKNSQQGKLKRSGFLKDLNDKKRAKEIDFLYFLNGIDWVELPYVKSENKKSVHEAYPITVPSKKRKSIHDFRIRVKKLRYVLELSEQENDKQIDYLEKMQEVSGKIHDLDVAKLLLKDFSKKSATKKIKKSVKRKRTDLYIKLLSLVDDYLTIKSA